MADRDEVVGGLLRSYLFEGMTAEQIEPLAGVPATRRLVRGEYVWHAGDPSDELYVVLSGEVKNCIVDIDGNELIHFVHGPGMTVGEPGFFCAGALSHSGRHRDDAHKADPAGARQPAALS